MNELVKENELRRKEVEQVRAEWVTAADAKFRGLEDGDPDEVALWRQMVLPVGAITAAAQTRPKAGGSTPWL